MAKELSILSFRIIEAICRFVHFQRYAFILVSEDGNLFVMPDGYSNIVGRYGL